MVNAVPASPSGSGKCCAVLIHIFAASALREEERTAVNRCRFPRQKPPEWPRAGQNLTAALPATVIRVARPTQTVSLQGERKREERPPAGAKFLNCFQLRYIHGTAGEDRTPAGPPKNATTRRRPSPGNAGNRQPSAATARPH